MYVVRRTHRDSEPDFKAFDRRPDAVEHFRVGSYLVWDDHLEGAALFEIPNVSNARIAVQAVKDGKAGGAIILDADTKGEVKKTVEDLIEKFILEGKLPPLIPTGDHA